MFNLLADAAAAAAAPAVTAAPAAKSAPTGMGGLMSNPMLLMILVFVIMIFFMSRSQKKQQRKRQEMLDAISKGAQVLLSSGIYGTVAEVQGDALLVEIASNVRIKVAKSGVADVLTAAVQETK